MIKLFNIAILTFCITLSVVGQVDTLKTKSGLKYISLKEGTGNKVELGSKVKVSYVGRFLDGKVFEQTEGKATFSYEVGDKGIIAGWNEGFLLMKEGGHAIFILPPQLAYGAKGSKDPYDENVYTIPPNTTIVYEVKLLKVK